MKKYAGILLGFFLSAFAISESLFIIPKNFPKPVYDFSKNPLTESKILLGRTLFYEPMLSKSNTISCESCHSQYAAFTHIDHALSHGIHDSIGTRNSPALMNLAWQKTFMWDGAINNLDMQALAPIAHPAEMGSNIIDVVKKLNASKKYRKLFYNAYKDSLVTGEKTLKAISQFMLTLVSANSKYDKVMRKELSFSTQESNGYRLFKKNCSSCHTEPLFTNGNYENNGLPVDSVLKDVGRMKITANSRDSLKFKVPTLRNIEYSYPYMHDGRFKKLSEVLNHYTNGINHSKTLAIQLQHGIILSSNEKVDLINFLLTLSDKEFVFNTKFKYPK
jgi:cytochrome c peroxidase